MYIEILELLESVDAETLEVKEHGIKEQTLFWISLEVNAEILEQEK